MNKSVLRYTSILLIISMSFLLLSSCSLLNKSNEDEDEDEEILYFYKAEKISIDSSITDNIQNLYYNSEKLYFIDESYDENLTPDWEDEDYIIGADGYLNTRYLYFKYQNYFDSKTTTLCKINTDGTGYELLSDFVETKMIEDEYGIVNTDILAISNKGDIWLTIKLDIFDDNGNDRTENYIVKTDETGNEIARKSLSELTSGYAINPVITGLTDLNGNLCFTDGERIYIINSEMERVFITGEVADTIVLSGTGEFLIANIATHNDMEVKVKRINLDDKALDDIVTLNKIMPFGFRIYSGRGDIDFIYTDNMRLYSYSIIDNTTNEMFIFSEIKIESTILDIFIINDDTIICTTVAINASQISQLSLNKIYREKQTSDGRTVITVAMLSSISVFDSLLDEIKDLIKIMTK